MASDGASQPGPRQQGRDPEPIDLTQLIARGPDGERDWSQLLPIVYDELRVLARRRLLGERAGHSVDATALVHEAYLRLLGDRHMDFESRRHFFGAAARAMQRVLIDRARKFGRQKRGGDRLRVTLGDRDFGEHFAAEQLIELNDALEVLEQEDSRAAEVARLKLFAGLEMAEIAEALELGERTAAREWAFARARLGEMLEPGDTP